MGNLENSQLNWCGRGDLNPRPVTVNPHVRGIEAYLSELLLTRKGTTENRARQILFEALPFLTDNPRAGTVAYLVWCKQQGNCNRTLANKLVRLSAFYRTQGVKLDVPKPTFVTKMPQVYSPLDLERFFGVCNGAQYRYFRTLLMAGLRMQEAKFLEWVDIEDGVICVRAKAHWIPKTSEERRVPIPRALSMELLKLDRISHLVFPTASGKPDCHALRTCKRLAAKAGLDPKKWSLHGFRRTCLSKLVNSGIGLPTAMSFAGHRDTKSALRYQRPLEGSTLQDRIETLWQ